MNSYLPEYESTWAESAWEPAVTLEATPGDENALQWLSNIGQGAATGAATGAVAGPWGALIGGLVGGGLGAAQTAMAQNQPAPPRPPAPTTLPPAMATPVAPPPAPAPRPASPPRATVPPVKRVPPRPAPVTPVTPVAPTGPRPSGPDGTIATVTTLLATLAPMIAGLSQQLQQVVPQAGGPHLPGVIDVPPGATITTGGSEAVEDALDEWAEAYENDCWSPEDLDETADDLGPEAPETTWQATEDWASEDWTGDGATEDWANEDWAAVDTAETFEEVW